MKLGIICLPKLTVSHSTVCIVSSAFFTSLTGLATLLRDLHIKMTWLVRVLILPRATAGAFAVTFRVLSRKHMTISSLKVKSKL